MDSQNQNQNPAPQTAPQMGTQSAPQQESKKVGPIVGILVLVLVAVIIALYMFASRISQEGNPTDSTNDTSAQVTATQTGPAVQAVTNKADDPQSLQDDLNSATNGLDSQKF